MIDIKIIREEPDRVRAGLAAKNVALDLDEFLKLDADYLASLQKIEELRAKQNEIGATVVRASADDRTAIVTELKKLKDEISTLEDGHKNLETRWKHMLRQIPNLPLADVRVGKDDSENKTVREVGKKPTFGFPIQDHIALGESLGILDFGRAAKIAGSRFVVLKGAAALLEFALIRYTYDTLLKHGFVPIVPPAMIKEDGMAAMGYMDRGADEIYKTQDDLYLIGTSEQPTGVMHADEVFEANAFPVRYIAFSSCFRREAGSYGKDTKGMIRVHQFDKLEMFSFVKPEDSANEHAFLLSCEEELVAGLGLPYQVLDICSGDLGDPAAKKYDIECWIPSQNRYRETHSTSNCTDFQARRLNIRYKNGAGKAELLHTLNGTAFAIGRIMVAIMENYQQADGSIAVPEALRAYCGFDTIKPTK